MPPGAQSNLGSVVTAALVLASASTVGVASAGTISDVPGDVLSGFGRQAPGRRRHSLSHRSSEDQAWRAANHACGISTLAQAFNLTRCSDPDRFSVYVYPPPRPLELTTSNGPTPNIDPTRFWSQIVAKMRDEEHAGSFGSDSAGSAARSINFTTNPDEACLLVPTVRMDCFENKCKLILSVA